MGARDDEDTEVTKVPELPEPPPPPIRRWETEDANRRLLQAALDAARSKADRLTAENALLRKRNEDLDRRNDELLAAEVERDELRNSTVRQRLELSTLRSACRETMMTVTELRKKLAEKGG